MPANIGDSVIDNLIVIMNLLGESFCMTIGNGRGFIFLNLDELYKTGAVQNVTYPL